jgi:hypothetical protein
MNFRLAKWDDYVAESKALFAALTPTTLCATGERKFQEVLLSAAKHNIPLVGTIPKSKLMRFRKTSFDHTM